MDVAVVETPGRFSLPSPAGCDIHHTAAVTPITAAVANSHYVLVSPTQAKKDVVMDARHNEDFTGQTIGHYAIVALVAAGGQGWVYRGRDTRLHRDVAIKVGRTGGRAGRQSLIDEARTLSLVNHPHVAGIYDFVTWRRRGFLVMEFVPGATLRDVLAGGPLPACEVARLGAALARGLAAAHAAGIVHGDIKPSNLKITSAGQLKILDFGAAQMLPAGALAHDEARTSSTRSLFGTLPYMPPEQLRGEPTDGRSDLFSAGAVLYEMVTGVRAFPQRDLGGLVRAIQHGTPARPTSVNPLVPLAIERIIVQAMHNDPAARPASAIALAEALEALMAHAAPAQPSREARRDHPGRTVRTGFLIPDPLAGARVLAPASPA